MHQRLIPFNKGEEKSGGLEEKKGVTNSFKKGG